jgi:hypothetical protein
MRRCNTNSRTDPGVGQADAWNGDTELYAEHWLVVKLAASGPCRIRNLGFSFLFAKTELFSSKKLFDPDGLKIAHGFYQNWDITRGSIAIYHRTGFIYQSDKTSINQNSKSKGNIWFEIRRTLCKDDRYLFGNQWTSVSPDFCVELGLSFRARCIAGT